MGIGGLGGTGHFGTPEGPDQLALPWGVGSVPKAAGCSLSGQGVGVPSTFLGILDSSLGALELRVPQREKVPWGAGSATNSGLLSTETGALPTARWLVPP